MERLHTPLTPGQLKVVRVQDRRGETLMVVPCAWMYGVVKRRRRRIGRWELNIVDTS
jgi:hypothetical protein